MKIFRKLLCRIGWHKWGAPKEPNGATYVQECKYCPTKKLVIQTITEGEFGTKVGGHNVLWDVKNKCSVEREGENKK